MSARALIGMAGLALADLPWRSGGADREHGSEARRR